MSKRILLIDSDEAFAQGLSFAANSRGFEATVATNSEQGMTLAKQHAPDLIVVCVEAQPTNGYMLCTRLKKDEQLKGIPVILTSAVATLDSFEKHKKLKTRAEEYLIKPFEPHILLEKASALLGFALPPEAPAEMASEEIVSMEDESLGLGDLVAGEDEPIHLTDEEVAQAHGQPHHQDEAVVVEEVEEVMQVSEEAPAEHPDDDLKMFDQAFDALESKPADGSDAKAFAGLRLAPAPGHESAPHHDSNDAGAQGQGEEEPRQHEPTELTAPDDDAVLHGLMGGEEGAGDYQPAIDHEAHAALEARVAQLEDELNQRNAELEAARKSTASSGELLKLKEARTKADKEVLRLKEELHARETELVELQETQTGLETQAQSLKDESVRREAAAKALQQRADALAAAAKKFERELGGAREELKQLSGLKAKSSELEKLLGAHQALQKKHEEAHGLLETEKGRADQLHTELAGAREQHQGEQDAARGELEAAQTALETANGELEAARKDLPVAQAETARLTEELAHAHEELEKVSTDVTALTGEKDLLNEDREDLRRQLDEAHASATLNEERAVKAFGKIKSDEKLREKTRKALQIALQLLDENQESQAGDQGPEKQSA